MPRTSKPNSASSPEPTFTADELLASVLATPQSDAEGLATWEIAERTGLNIRTVGERLRALHRQKRLISADRYERNMRGRMTTVPVYRIQP